jgi:hypothetical protein
MASSDQDSFECLIAARRRIAETRALCARIWATQAIDAMLLERSRECLATSRRVLKQSERVLETADCVFTQMDHPLRAESEYIGNHARHGADDASSKPTGEAS